MQECLQRCFENPQCELQMQFDQVDQPPRDGKISRQEFADLADTHPTDARWTGTSS